MNYAFWFMVVQSLTCLGGGLAFAFVKKDFWLAWVWVSYAVANVGFAMMALR